MKNNKYIQRDNEPYWERRPDWYTDRHRMSWYESIDLNAMYEDGANDDMMEVIRGLIDYARIRDRVIDQRASVAFHVGFMLRFILHSHEGTVYTVEQLLGILKMLREYLQQMQVTSATDSPDAPTRFPPKSE